MSTRSFDDLVEAIAGAVINARELLEAQHLDTMSRYFSDTDGDGKLEARTQTVKLPNTKTDSQDDFVEVQIPLFALVPLNSLKLKEVEVELEAYLSSLEDSETDMAPGSDTLDQGKKVKRKKINMELSGGGYVGSKKNNVKIKVTMEGSDPPEGLVRVNGHVLKQIP